MSKYGNAYDKAHFLHALPAKAEKPAGIPDDLSEMPPFSAESFSGIIEHGKSIRHEQRLRGYSNDGSRPRKYDF